VSSECSGRRRGLVHAGQMHERSVTGVVLSLGAGISPMLASVLVENRASTSLSFVLPGGIKMVYDLLSLVSNARAPDEAAD
jgi:hypothetical protein